MLFSINGLLSDVSELDKFDKFRFLGVADNILKQKNILLPRHSVSASLGTSSRLLFNKKVPITIIVIYNTCVSELLVLIQVKQLQVARYE
jgi:hypothetical protein